jgi:hypothetical protein
MAISVARRRSVRERSPSPITRLKRLMAASTKARRVGKRLWCGELHRIKADPEAVLIPEGPQAALGGYARPGEYKDVHQRIRCLIPIQSQAGRGELAGANRDKWASASAPSCRVRSPAGTSRPKAAACPDHKGEKSPDPAASALARSGTNAPAARGNSGARSDMGPTSRTIRLTIPRAGRPVNTFVRTMSLSFALLRASRWSKLTLASGQNR